MTQKIKNSPGYILCFNTEQAGMPWETYARKGTWDWKEMMGELATLHPMSFTPCQIIEPGT